MATEPTQAEVRVRLCELADGVPPSPRADPSRLESERQLRPGLMPTVAYLLPGLPPEGSGGSHSLVQEARGLRTLGAGASVCVPAESLAGAARLYGNEGALFVPYPSEPTVLGASDSSVLDAVADASVVIATEYPSVDLLARLQRERPEVVCAYYVQDYEPLFAAPESSRSDRALLSYRAVAGLLLFAKTHWLCNLVSAAHGVSVAKVQPSLDTELFHARGRVESDDAVGHADAGGESVDAGEPRRVVRVTAMIRPRTPRRRPAATLQALAGIGETLGEGVEIVTFGCEPESFAELEAPVVPGLRHLGLLSRAEVAELMRRCDVFIDASAYQAFGRTGLEAMACGAVPLLPALGGVHEYAVHDGNAVILDHGGPEEIAAAVIGLARDRARLQRLRQAGVLAAQGFSIERAARSQLELFADAVARRSSQSTRESP